MRKSRACLIRSLKKYLSMTKIILKLIRFYQKTISPDHGALVVGAARCRFYPSCSEYAIQSVEKHGPVKGLFKSVVRILKCNPVHPGGVDLA